MNKSPILQIRHREDEDWFIAATWPDGRREEIPGFKSESEANVWVARELHAWLADGAKPERPNA